MARLSGVRALFVTLLIATACRGDGRAPNHTPHPSGGSASPEQTTAVPPGSDELVPVPSDVASKVALKEIAHGLKRPVLLTSAPNDARRRLFIVEQAGAIQILENGKLHDKPFFTIGELSHGNEEGLLGLAFHPRFAENRKLYVNYTAKDMSTHIVEYQVSASDPDTVDTSTRREIIRIDQPYSNHNGGNLAFGPDGKLYTGMGDGGAANDPHGNGQNDRTLLAKILRFDVDHDGKPEIVHIGMRNPWRFWFDKPTGDLYIGDVGQNLWEEVDVIPGSDHGRENFGWNVLEGTHCFDAESGGNLKACDRDGMTPPVVEYNHQEGCSI